jgi:hypothetical protein
MTIDEALLKIQETQRCFVVWNSETGEILSVSRMKEHPDGKELLSHLQDIGTFGSPVKARYFESSKVTRQVLEKEQAETERVKTRVRVLTQWAAAPSADLLRVLEAGAYSYPMARDNDSRVIVDHLWRVHRDELTEHTQMRLSAPLGTSALSGQASQNLEVYLLALCGDEQTLLNRWNPGQLANLPEKVTMMECFAHTNTRNKAVIDDLIRIVETDRFLFHPRGQAMTTLGKLNAARETRAADAIRASVHDSTPEIIAARDRVLARLNSSGTEWTRCPECSYGWIHSSSGPVESPCPACFGLGLLQAE